MGPPGAAGVTATTPRPPRPSLPVLPAQDAPQGHLLDEVLGPPGRAEVLPLSLLCALLLLQPPLLLGGGVDVPQPQASGHLLPEVPGGGRHWGQETVRQGQQPEAAVLGEEGPEPRMLGCGAGGGEQLTPQAQSPTCTQI